MENKLLNRSFLIILIGIIFCISSSILSFQLIVDKYYNLLNIIVTCFVSFICALIYYKKSYKETYKIIKNNPVLFVLSIIAAIIIVGNFYFSKALVARKIFKNTLFNPFDLSFFVLSFGSVLYLCVNILHQIKLWFIKFYQSLDAWDKKVYLVTSVIVSLLIIVCYSKNSNWFLLYDKIYSMDSGFVFNNMFSKISYYDIRHPLFSVFSFPIYAIASQIAKFTVGGRLYSVVVAILIQLFNAQFLIFVGMYLKKMTKKRIVFILYMLSFSTMLATLFIEKYQLCIFLLVLYVFTICTRKEKSILPLIGSAGTILTSAAIGFSELLVKDNFKDKLRKIACIVIVTLLSFICLGRAHVLICGLDEIHTMTSTFASVKFPIKESLLVFTKMVRNCFIALPSSIDGISNTYSWISLHHGLSSVSILITLIILIGIITCRKNLFTKISIFWFVFGFILFAIIKWSVVDAPLFSIYFSWAFIPLFVEGLSFLIKKFKLNYKLIYTLLIIYMIVINLSTIVDISNYLSVL